MKVDRVVEIESEIGAFVFVYAHEHVVVETSSDVGRRIAKVNLVRIVLDETEIVNGGYELHLEIVVDVVDVVLSERQVGRGRVH